MKPLKPHAPHFIPRFPSLQAFPHASYVDVKEGWIKLNANEAPYPPSPAVLRALHKILERGGEALSRYPEPASPRFKLALGHHYGLSPTRILLGHGSQEILEVLIQTVCHTGDTLAYLKPDYPLYAFLAQKYGLTPLPLAFSQSLDSLPLEKLEAPILCLSSPHWPTGFQFSTNAIREVLERFPGWVVLDEAYVHFGRKEDTLSLLEHYPRLLLLRSFSKAYALANLRIAYLLGSPPVLEALEKRLSIYKISSMDEAAGLAALQDTAYYAHKISNLKAQKEATFGFLRSLGWHTYPSEANFLLTQPKTSQGHTGHALALEVYAYLKSHKILVRSFNEEPLTDSYLRISIGTASEMTILHHTLKAYSQGLCSTC